jgi:hypothetical protein
LRSLERMSALLSNQTMSSFALSSFVSVRCN